MASRVCEASAKWPSVEPWCEFLRVTTRVRLTTDHLNELLVSVRLRPRQYWRTLSPRELVLVCREALELLAMIAVVDPVSWQQLLQDRCGCEKYKFWDDWAQPPRFWVKLGDTKGIGDEHDTDYYRVFFCDFDETSPKRAKFRAAAAKIQSAMTREVRYKLWCHEAFPVYVRCIPPRGIKAEQTNAYLENVVKLVKATIQTRERAATSASSASNNTADKVRSSRLVLGDVEVHTTRLMLLPESSRILAEFFKFPIQSVGFYPGTNIASGSAIGRLSATEFEPLLTALVNRTPTPLVTRNETLPSPNFVYILNNNRHNTLEAHCAFTLRWKAVCSAIQTSQHADEFQVDTLACGIAHGTRAKRYQWLTYALFSKESTTTVKKVTLCDLDFYQEDINSMLSILNAKNPASKLGGFARRSKDMKQLARRPVVAMARKDAEDEPGARSNGGSDLDDDDSEGSNSSDDGSEHDDEDNRSTGSEAAVSNDAAIKSDDSIDSEDGAGMDDTGGAADEGQNGAENTEDTENADIPAEDQGSMEDDEDDGDDEDDEAEDVYGGDYIDSDDEPGIEDEDPDVRAYFTEDFGDMEEQPLQDPGSVVLKKGTLIVIEQFTPEGQDIKEESLVLSEDGVFRVIDSSMSSEFVNIIVPSYGSCNVKRESIDQFVSVPGSQASSISLGYSGSITALRLSCLAIVNADIFLSLLKYLGTKLTSLELEQDLFLDPSSLNEVLAACPHLTSLRVDGADDWPDEDLLTAYSDGRCKLTKLHMGSMRPRPPTLDFVRALQDPTTKIAQTLRKLSMFHGNNCKFGDTILTAIIEMLEANSVLEFFEIAIYPEEATKFKSRLLEFHGQVLHGTKGPPPPLGCRLAFLSVLKSYSCVHTKSDRPSESKRARRGPAVDLEHIDRGVLSLIFQFAGELRTRRIRIQITDVNPLRFMTDAYLREEIDSDDDSVA